MPGAAHEHPHWTRLLGDVQRGADLVLARDIRGGEADARPQFPGQCLAPGGRQVQDDDIRPLARQSAGGRLAQAGSASGDDGHASGQIHALTSHPFTSTDSGY